MPSSTKIYVTSVWAKNRETFTPDIIEYMRSKHGIYFTYVYSIQDLFPLLSNPQYQVDIIAVDTECFYSVPGTEPYQIIQSLDTIINCTVYRPETGESKISSRPVKRTTKIVAVVDHDQDPQSVKEIYSCPHIFTLAYKCKWVGGIPEGGLNDIVQQITDISQNKKALPKAAQLILRRAQRTVAKNKAEVKLTPRQRQIYNIVSERGVSNKVIGRMLNLSESTIKLHMGAIFKKYGVKNRTQLALFSKNNKPADTGKIAE